MSETNGNDGNGERDDALVVPPAAPAAEARRGVRVAEFGRAGQTIYLDPGASVRLRDLIAEKLLPAGRDIEYFINSVRATGLDHPIVDGDAVAAIKNIELG